MDLIKKYCQKYYQKCKEIFEQKKWVRVVSYVAASLVILLIVAHLFLGHIVKGSIQTVGPLIAGVPMSVRSVSISVLGNFGVTVKDLVIGNPEGYSSPHALKMKNFQLRVKTFSLLSDKIVVDKLELTGVEVNFETNVVASNLTDINNNVAKLAPKAEGEKVAEKDDDSKESGKAPPKIQVNSINISDITVRVIAKGANAAGLPVPMVPIKMTDLGTGPEGITPSALISEMLTKLITGVTSLVSSGAATITDGASAAAGAVGDAAKDAGKAVGNAAKDAGKKLKNLFGGK